jgi:hypothetical protein
MTSRMPNALRLAAVAAALLAPAGAPAQGFGMHVAPPRFELSAAPGDRVREVIQITNPEPTVGRYAAFTADWNLNEKGEIAFNEGEPGAGSCRPWVRIERRKVSVAPGASRAYRFEVHVPADATAKECRFAIMVGSDPESEKGMRLGQVNVPVGGQIAVIVYVAVAGAKPELHFKGLRKGIANSVPVPVAVFENTGNAHGRPEGILVAKDASGKEFEVYVNAIPILPGQTREAPIFPSNVDTGRAVKFVFPLTLKGTIEWQGGKQVVNQTLP